jgi:hypothetical protein
MRRVEAKRIFEIVKRGSIIFMLSAQKIEPFTQPEGQIGGHLGDLRLVNVKK